MKARITGGVFVTTGSVFLIESCTYELGSLSAMGPGYFPALIASALIMLGLTMIR